MPHPALETLVDDVIALQHNIKALGDWTVENEYLIEETAEEADDLPRGEERSELMRRVSLAVMAQTKAEEELTAMEKELQGLEAILNELEYFSANAVYYGEWLVPLDFMFEEEFAGHVAETVAELGGEVEPWSVRQDYRKIEIYGQTYRYR